MKEETERNEGKLKESSVGDGGDGGGGGGDGSCGSGGCGSGGGVMGLQEEGRERRQNWKSLARAIGMCVVDGYRGWV